jgi:hypothetical protein
LNTGSSSGSAISTLSSRFKRFGVKRFMHRRRNEESTLYARGIFDLKLLEGFNKIGIINNKKTKRKNKPLHSINHRNPISQLTSNFHYHYHYLMIKSRVNDRHFLCPSRT